MGYVAARHAGAEGAPLVLTFHGTGGDEHQFHGLAQQILPEAHVTSPRGDVSEHGAARYFRRTGEGVYDMADLAARTKAMAAFIAAEKAATGAEQVYAMGYSNGANILASVLFHAPDLVQRAALLHPLIPFDPGAVPGLSGAKVLITAGERDPICPAPQTRALGQWFADQGADIRDLWHPGGHELIPAEIEAAAALFRG